MTPPFIHDDNEEHRLRSLLSMHSIQSQILVTDPQNPSKDVIDQAVRLIQSGGVVIVPTHCLYGLAADAYNPEAIQKVFEIKNRPETNPLLIFIKNKAWLDDIVTHIPSCAMKLMDTFWPGKLTLIFNAKHHLHQALTAGTGKIGIRIPGHPVTSALVQSLDRPITGTSANISGEKGSHSIHQISSSILQNADLCLDAGTLNTGQGSTVVDITCSPIKIIREGIVSSREIFEALD